MLERALFATKAMGAAIALRGRTEMVCMAPQGTCSRSRDAFRPKIRVFRNVRTDRPDSICDDAETDPRVDRAACQRLGARSIIAVPLLDRGKAVGILEVFSGTAHAFDDNDIRHLDLLAKMTVEATADVRPADAAESAPI